MVVSWYPEQPNVQMNGSKMFSTLSTYTSSQMMMATLLAVIQIFCALIF